MIYLIHQSQILPVTCPQILLSEVRPKKSVWFVTLAMLCVVGKHGQGLVSLYADATSLCLTVTMAMLRVIDKWAGSSEPIYADATSLCLTVTMAMLCVIDKWAGTSEPIYADAVS